MKKVTFIVLVLTFGVFFSDSLAKKPKKQKQTVSIQTEEDSLKMANELEILKLQLMRDSIERERRMELEKMKSQMEAERERTEEMSMPCQEEAQSNEEYYAAWGMSDHEMNAPMALQKAMVNAQMELAKQIGGENVEMKDVEIVCRTTSRDIYGNHIAYVAIRMHKKK